MSHHAVGKMQDATASFAASQTRNGVRPAAIVSDDRQVERVAQPGQADRVDQAAPDQHHRERATEATVPAELGQPSDDGARQQEPDDVAAGRTEEDRGPAPALGEERQPDQAEQDVQRDGREPAPGAERAAHDEHTEGLAGPRDGLVQDVDLGGHEDHQRPGDDQHDVPETGVEALGERDGDEEVGDREAAFRSGRAVQPRDGDRHLDSATRGPRRVRPTERSLASDHSYWTARTMDSRLAMRAG